MTELEQIEANVKALYTAGVKDPLATITQLQRELVETRSQLDLTKSFLRTLKLFPGVDANIISKIDMVLDEL